MVLTSNMRKSTRTWNLSIVGQTPSMYLCVNVMVDIARKKQ